MSEFFDLGSDTDVVEARRFVRWAREYHGIDYPGFSTWAGDADVIAERHPELYIQWRAARRIGAI